MRQIPIEERFKFDKSLDLFFQQFCQCLLKEISGGPVKKDITSYVDYYGKEVKGFLSFNEFKDIYMVHVNPHQSTQEDTTLLSPKPAATRSNANPAVEEGKLRALFGIFDHQSLGRVSS